MLCVDPMAKGAVTALDASHPLMKVRGCVLAEISVLEQKAANQILSLPTTAVQYCVGMKKLPGICMCPSGSRQASILLCGVGGAGFLFCASSWTTQIVILHLCTPQQRHFSTFELRLCSSFRRASW